MFELLGIPPQALFGQLLLGLINGSFYAMLSLGLAVIFGLLNIINFAHGAQYMMGAFAAWMLGNYLGLGYWWALLLAPIIVGAHRHRHRAADAVAALPSRPPLRAAADLRPRADHPGPVPQRLRGLRAALHHAHAAGGRAEPRLHVPAQLPRLGGGGLADRLLRHLVPDREDPARLLPARRDREPDAGRRLRHQRAAADHPDLRLRRRPRRLRRRAGGADLLGQSQHGRRPHHRRLRGGGHRRHGLDHGRHPHRLRPRHHRGPDPGLLSRGIGGGDLRHHGAGAAGEARRACSGGPRDEPTRPRRRRDAGGDPDPRHAAAPPGDLRRAPGSSCWWRRSSSIRSS